MVDFECGPRKKKRAEKKTLNARGSLNQAGDTPPNNLCTLSTMKNISAKLILDILSLKSQGKKLTIFTPLPLTHREERTGC